MKFRAHETFFIRKGWLSKGMKYVVKTPDVFSNKKIKASDILGIGTNMVIALRYWLQAVGLTKEIISGKKREQVLTAFGKLVFDKDRYIEELGTLYLLQYKLAVNEEFATSWYYFFNKFNVSEFTKEDFISFLQSEFSLQNKDLPIRSVEDDFICILNTYIPRYKSDSSKISPENNIDCPFGELGLLDILNKQKHIYKKSIPPASSFNDWCILAVIMDYAINHDCEKEIQISSLLTDEKSIGKIFNLDSMTLLDILHSVEKTNELKIVRTAGLDVVNLQNIYTFEECVAKFYESVSEK